ncbi:MAG: DUF1800 domain-containing protein, partial [Bacteroidota bacterium]
QQVPFSLKKSEVPADEYEKRNPRTSHINSKGLTPYTGEFTETHLKHLLGRATFGAKKADLEAAQGLSLNQVLDALFTAEPEPTPPLNVSTNDTAVPVGQTWVDAELDFNVEGDRLTSLVAWWTGLAIHQRPTLREQMTMFWHNHFVTGYEAVNDSRFMYRYVKTLRENALGNFRELTEKITIDGAMLIYLNGTENEVSAPNENYARELFELFTIGKGEQVAAGDYTTYTEEDVLAASRVLTGWVAYRPAINTFFIPERHDAGEKTFSAAFGNQTISNQGENEYKALISMIFDKKETARFICRKLYRWFVYYVIEDQVERNVIEPMAEILYQNNYEIEPALRALFASEHFHDLTAQGCLIKNPMQYTIGLFRQYEMTFPDENELVNQYHMWAIAFYLIELMEMSIGNPPGVAGWPAYYQKPLYHELWINSVTLPFRRDVATFFVFGGYENDGFRLATDIFTFVDRVISNPADVNVFIDDLVSYLFPLPITDSQRDFLKETLRPGIPDNAWTFEWDTYLQNQNNEDIARAMYFRIANLLHTMTSMAEYHLS